MDFSKLLEIVLEYLKSPAHIIGILGILATVIGFQFKKHSWVIGFRTANELLFALNYLLLGGYTGFALNIVSSCRNIIFAEYVKRNKSTVVWRIVFCVFFTVATFFTWGGFGSIFFLAGKITTTYAYGSKNMTLLRILSIITGILWIFYNLTIGAYEAIVLDAFTIATVIVAIARFDIAPLFKNKKELA